jgi:very-short-patch-repair endonuclease
MSDKNPRKTLDQRRELRRNQTSAEEVLWGEVRAKKIKVKVRRQYGIGPYVLDFYIPSLKLAIEVDGKIHLKSDVILKDKNRTAYLKRAGIWILRFKNEQIENDIDKVLISIKDKIDELMNNE